MRKKSMSRPTFVNIDLAALKANLERVRQITSGCSIIAMVKANGYGHGLSRVAKALPNADAFGVASLEEGVILREAGITQPIVLMEGLFYLEELAEAARHQFTLVVHHEPHLEMLEKANLAKPLAVWLKINTGMCRLGIEPDQLAAFYQRLQAANAVQKPIGFMTHFAEADMVDSDATNNQIALFNKITEQYAGPRSLSNSAGILAWNKAHGDWVRPGLMLYGASPFADRTGIDVGLQPVMTLWSRLISITHVKRGAKVGYGGTWTAPYDTKVGIVGVGYGDGYPQHAANGTPVLVNGKRTQLVGRVSMDMLAVDLHDLPDAQIGDQVILWGKDLPVELIAKHSNMSVYEILTRMTQRPKVEVKGLVPEDALNHEGNPH
jgi:alanine racemase